MRILISNDDGVHAPGIRALAQSLKKIAEVIVIAPDTDKSATSHALTVDRPLSLTSTEEGFVCVNGTPTDCVHMALNGWLDERPDMVVSGINRGANLGDDVMYSGTVAAACEGRLLGLPAIAFSLVQKEHRTLLHYESAARIAQEMVQTILKGHAIAQDTLLNVNIPDLPYEDIRGIKVTRLGKRHPSQKIVPMLSPGKRELFWVGPQGVGLHEEEDTDFWAVEHGYVSVTPLLLDWTRYSVLNETQSWVDSIDLF